MATVKFINSLTQFVNVPTWFVTDYMPQASNGHIKVYLYLLMLYQSHSSDLTLEDLSKKLDMLHSELMTSLDFWNKSGVLTFETSTNDSYTLSFASTKPEVKSQTKPSTATAKPIFYQQTRPHYTTEEIMLYKEQHSSIATLFQICEKYLCRLLTPSDQQVLYGFYDWLNMPLDLIEYLIEYCASNNHRHMRYIEKVALGWHEQGIKTVDAAKAQTTLTSKYRQILKTLGMNSETITKHQRDILDKWLFEYKLPIEVILEGCNRTVAYSSNPSLNYLGSILEKWHKQGVNSTEMIYALDKQHQESTTPQSKNTKKVVSKNPYFTSTYSHNWDLDELERKEREYINKKFSGGNP